nr:hypothetical protein [Tanacetum cinerariifolium]
MLEVGGIPNLALLGSMGGRVGLLLAKKREETRVLRLGGLGGKSCTHDEVLKLKNFKKDAILKLFKLTNQERYKHVGPNVTSSQDGKVYKMAKRDYAWLMISRRFPLAAILGYDPLNGSLPTLSASNTSGTRVANRTGSSIRSTNAQPVTPNRLPLSNVTNYFPQRLNTSSRVGKPTRISNADISQGINPLLENNARQTTNAATSSAGRASLTPQKATNVAVRLSSFGTQNRTPNSQQLLVSQRAVVRNTQAGVLPNSLPTIGDQVNPVAATHKRQTPLNDISNGNGYDKNETKSKQNRTKPSIKRKAWKSQQSEVNKKSNPTKSKPKKSKN